MWRAIATGDSPARSRSRIWITSADSGPVPGAAIAEVTAARIAARSARSSTAVPCRGLPDGLCESSHHRKTSAPTR